MQKKDYLEYSKSRQLKNEFDCCNSYKGHEHHQPQEAIQGGSCYTH